MGDQADSLRRLIETAMPAAPVTARGPALVAVTGSGAGVGATTVAVNLAAALVKQSKRVLLVDGSEGGSKMAEIAGVRSTGDFSLGDVLVGKCKMGDALLEGPAGTTLLLNHQRRPKKADASRQRKQSLLAELQAFGDRFGVIVIDSGSGATTATRRLWLRAALAVLVSTTDDAAVMDAYAALKRHTLGARGTTCGHIRLLVNRAETDRIAADAHRRLTNCCQRFLRQSVTALPALPTLDCEDASVGMWPRVWEAPNSEFGRAALWLGRGVSDAVETAMSGAKVACTFDSNAMSKADPKMRNQLGQWVSAP